MTKVLVVDDSQFMRTVVGNILSGHGYDVTTASNGERAVEAVATEDPDVVTMDVEMPEMDGIEAVERIMATNPARILMVSAHTEEGADATLRALSHGAIDFVTKPDGEVSTDIGSLEAELVETVTAVEEADVSSIATQRATRTAAAASETEAAVSRARETVARANEAVTDATDAVRASSSRSDGEATTASPGATPASRPREEAATGTLPDGPFLEHPTVVVGASTGGPKTIERILRRLPLSLDARVLVVQHMPSNFTGRLAARLDTLCEYDVSEASDGTRVRGGEVCIAKGGYHMEVVHESTDGLRLQLTDGEKLHGVRPAIDVTMCTAARTVSRPLVGVALTGMGKDGARGIAAVKDAGGTTIAQDEDTSPVFGIPEQAIATGKVDRVLPAGRITDGVLEALTEGENNG